MTIERLPEDYLPPFSAEALAFLGDWSKSLTKAGRAHPELMALAFWLGPGRLRRLVADYHVPADVVLRPRGAALHIAPGNVDTIFVYSWALSLLAGNSNYLRLSSSENPALALLLETLGELLPRHPEIERRTRLLRYPRERRDLSEALSSWADVRLLWGGDATVQTFRSMPTSPTCLDLAFADKHSLAVFRASAVLAADDLPGLARKFYLDAYTFDQMGCSSPRSVYWVGTAADCQMASAAFWNALETLVPPQPDSVANLKLLEAGVAVTALEAARVAHWGRASVVRVEGETPRTACGGGLFWEVCLGSLDDLTARLQASDQTLAHYGFEGDELRAWLRSYRGPGLERLVPVGSALNFQAIWDGFELLDVLTRKTYLSGS